MSSKVKYWNAINQAIAEEMERDDRVILLGQDAAEPGGAFGETRGLYDRFGKERVRDTPISEQAMMGTAIGAAAMGLRPIVEFLFMDFFTLAADQMVNQAAKLRYFSNGNLRVPLVVKTGVGTGVGMGAQHSQSLESWFSQVPGIPVCWASNPSNAKGLMKQAIRSDEPVLFIESLGALGSTGELDEDEAKFVLGKAEKVNSGDDCTIVTYGSMRGRTEKAVGKLAELGVAVDLIDLQWITPWDRDMVFESVRRTNHCVIVTEAPVSFGPGGEFSSAITEACFDYLDAPVIRVGPAGIPAPHIREYDEWRIPGPDEIVASVMEVKNLEVRS